VINGDDGTVYEEEMTSVGFGELVSEVVRVIGVTGAGSKSGVGSMVKGFGVCSIWVVAISSNGLITMDGSGVRSAVGIEEASEVKETGSVSIESGVTVGTGSSFGS
jgi:hypothetical protein